MRINIRAEGFDRTPQLRAAVEARLSAALGSFGDRIQVVAVHLHARRGLYQPDATTCEIVATVHPSGEVRVRADDAQMRVSVDRAAQAIRVSIDRELAQPSPRPHSPAATEEVLASGALEIVLDNNRISHQTREMLERPEHHLRPVRIREYWRPAKAEDVARPNEIEELGRALVR
jgi:ribosome-associated translation inhibitor RaiA